ncbi:MAG TPA: ankyrin repeat domain-containing protein [Anaerolineae bacterium]|nr:ankyrin repeat domain-containing protein [Anaerolineae bacterium]
MNPHDFIEAIKAGEIEQVTQALDQDITLVNAKADNSLSAVLVAAYYNEPQIAQLLVQRGAELNIFEAATVGALDRVEGWIVAQPELINAYAPDGFQPIGLAAFFGHAAIVELLLRVGADVDAPSKNAMRVRPLHSAIANRRSAIAKLLIEHGADVNSTQADDFAPLHEAAQNGLLDVTQWLLDRGANVSAQLTNGKTPLALAIEAEHAEVADVLRRYGAID